MSEKRPIELLAPAKDLAVGMAAIRAGADAVYIGAPCFGARKAAGNSMADIAELIRFAHIYSAKVHCTLNTLLSPAEREEAVALALQLQTIGSDAIIVQDEDLMDELLALPGRTIALHASTQCDNRTAERVRHWEKKGLERVVLARELSLQEIADIRKQTNIELEAFVHGALCVCYSGKCFMSEVLCGRSANRGECAQLCRLPYDVLDADEQEMVHTKHVLSLHDMDRSNHLPELLQAGVCSLKIEGRLKDAEYVRNIVGYYRHKLDALFTLPDFPYCRSSKGESRLRFTPNPEKTFHRGGIPYFLNGRTAKMANFDNPKSTGEPVGEVVRSKGKELIVHLLPQIELHNGDGLCVGKDGALVNQVGLTHDGVRLVLSQPIDANVGAVLYRNLDIAFERQMKSGEDERKLKVDILFEETPSGFALCIGSARKMFDAEKTEARNADMALSAIRQQITKLGGTCYEAGTVDIRLTKPYFLPVSVLNEWRRQTLELLLSKSAEVPATEITPIPSAAPFSSRKGEPLMTCRYCLLHEMGLCRKQRQGQDDAHLREPKYLRTPSGQLLTLTFDCKNCQMTIDEHKSL